ncbi:MAG: RNA polymerase sigma factor [Deltaproteobacteria bacterium]|nr:RNA polymerase sigma factor [Deltaproteobacteria bacterium]
MPADIATLLAEAPWLARLARRLTGDPAEADDLVQDTYAAALRSPPATDRPLRPWLRRVAINLARMRHRSRSRRAATEGVVETQTEPVRDAQQLLERARVERRLAELVLELDEPFRTMASPRVLVAVLHAREQPKLGADQPRRRAQGQRWCRSDSRRAREVLRALDDQGRHHSRAHEHRTSRPRCPAVLHRRPDPAQQPVNRAVHRQRQDAQRTRERSDRRRARHVHDSEVSQRTWTGTGDPVIEPSPGTL